MSSSSSVLTTVLTTIRSKTVGTNGNSIKRLFVYMHATTQHNNIMMVVSFQMLLRNILLYTNPVADEPASSAVAFARDFAVRA